jgi:hypothetical protein
VSGYADEYQVLVGRTIKSITPMTDEELKMHDWADRVYAERACVIELDNGTYVVPVADPEGNTPGALWVINPEEQPE